MAVLLGLLVALSYGAGDFLGGLATRRNTALVVVATSQGMGLVLLIVAVALTPGNDPIAADLGRGAAAGSIGLIGLVLLYRGLAAGSMSIIAPVTSVGAAVIPLVWGLATGERPHALAFVGVLLALGAVALVAAPAVDVANEEVSTSGDNDMNRELGLALAAGAAFGMVFILLDSAGDDAGLWPVLAARVASVTLVTALVLARGQRPTVPRSSFWLVLGAGILDVTANGLFVLAVREGLLSIVAVLSSLYPVATVLLARIVLIERLARRQRVGLVLALGGVLLIASG